MAFRVGQRVVCVDARPGFGSGFPVNLILRAEYIIASVQDNGDVSVGESVWYAPRRFRPIVDRKTDIGFAHEILRKVSKPKKVAA